MGFLIIAIKLPFNRSWASVQRALQKAQFKITDQNREEGTYHVRYMPIAKKDDAKKSRVHRPYVCR